MNLIRSGVDTYVLYQIVKRIATPFTEWRAYQLGVIDDRGNFLIPKNKRTNEQYYSLTYLDIFVLNLKKLLQKIPGANNKFVTYAAALWLLREDRYIEYDLILEDGEAAPAGSGSVVPANTSGGGYLARSSEKEAKAFKYVTRNKIKRLARKD